MSLINFQSELEQNYSGKKCTIYLILKVCQLSQVLLLNNMTL